MQHDFSCNPMHCSPVGQAGVDSWIVWAMPIDYHSISEPVVVAEFKFVGPPIWGRCWIEFRFDK